VTWFRAGSLTTPSSASIDVLARHRHATLQVIAAGAADRRRVLEKSLARVPVLSLGDGVGG
jgi:hypothetical protein